MKAVPFYSNTPDDTHCFQAALKMVLGYFLPDKEFSFSELDTFTDKKEGLWTWPIRGVINLSKMGFEIVDVDFFSLEDFVKAPESYLLERYGKEVGQAQIDHSDLPVTAKDCLEYISMNVHQERIPELNEIKEFLDKGFLVVCNVNAYAFHSKTGYAGHFVVVYKYQDDFFWVHDPGLPPIEALKVNVEQFLKGWEYPDERSRNLLALKYEKRN